MIKKCKKCGREFVTNNKHRNNCDDCRNNKEIIQEEKKKIDTIWWFEEERDIVKKMFQEGKSYEEIADVINKNRREKSSADLIPYRGPRAVAFQAQKIGLITTQELKEWDEQRELKKKKERQQDFYKTKKKVFERDNHRCVVCNSKDSEFAHIIPFDKSRVNKEKEAITLCHRHHKIFDGHKLDVQSEFSLSNKRNEITRTIFNKMCSYYPDYPEEYELFDEYCSYHKIFHCIIKKRNEKNSTDKGANNHFFI